MGKDEREAMGQPGSAVGVGFAKVSSSPKLPPVVVHSKPNPISAPSPHRNEAIHSVLDANSTVKYRSSKFLSATINVESDTNAIDPTP